LPQYDLRIRGNPLPEILKKKRWDYETAAKNGNKKSKYRSRKKTITLPKLKFMGELP
jgi:hypothetical protein